MVVEEIILGGIADAVFGYTFERGTDRLGGWIRGKLGLDSIKTAFKEALRQTFERFDKQYPHWVANNFDISFFEHEAVPILAQFLIRDGHPDPSELAQCWADSLNILHPERRSFYTRELEPVAADFLEDLAHFLKGKAELGEIHDSRAFEQIAESLRLLRRNLEIEKATFGTRRDYLRWLIGRNLYLDSRGTLQTQRQVQLKLDEVYISLYAQRDEAPSVSDISLVEHEASNLETFLTLSHRNFEEIEDRWELAQVRVKSRQASDELGKVFELATVVTQNDRVVILGDPGSGKTTLLQHLALKHAEALWNGQHNAEEDLGITRFPILLRIAEYSEGGNWKKKSLSDFLINSPILHDCPKSGVVDLLQTELEKGNCLVLLDGLDEIVNADERLGIVKQIEDFVRRYVSQGNHFVTTSRKAGYRSAPLAESFVHFTIQGMDEAQIHRFLEHWCQAVEDVQTPELSLQERRNVAMREVNSIMKAVQTSVGVRRLATNPLLLRILALIHRTGAQLPQKRIELYKLATDTLARTWRMAQGVPESALVREEYLTPLLGKLAYWLHLNKPTGIATEQEVYEILGEEWARLNDIHWERDTPNLNVKKEISKFLVEVREHTGLFVERAPKRYGFLHLTFEEYYVARYLIASSKKRVKLIRQHLHQIRWQESILLALGFVGLEYPIEASELVETVILAEGEDARDLGFVASSYEDLLGRDFLFILRCLGDNIPIRARLVKRLIEQLSNELLYHTGPARFTRYRETLKEVLTYCKNNEWISLLIPMLTVALHDGDDDVRIRAAESLSQLGQATPEVIAALVTLLSKRKEDIKTYIEESLALLSQDIIVSILFIIVKLDKKDDIMSYDIIKNLEQLEQDNELLIKSFIKMFLCKDREVRKKCSKVLLEFGRYFPSISSKLEEMLALTVCDPAYGKYDEFDRGAFEYVYDTLWSMLIGSDD